MDALEDLLQQIQGLRAVLAEKSQLEGKRKTGSGRKMEGFRGTLGSGGKGFGPIQVLTEGHRRRNGGVRQKKGKKITPG